MVLAALTELQIRVDGDKCLKLASFCRQFGTVLWLKLSDQSSVKQHCNMTAAVADTVD